MNDISKISKPPELDAIQQDTVASGFTMASDLQTGTLLRTLAASKPGGRLLELGTGTGLSTAWILDGMDSGATLISLDNDDASQSIASKHLANDIRVEFVLDDGGTFLESQLGQQFDFVFADTWPGKYTHLELALGLLAPGAFYIIDDMLAQPNWPSDHPPKVQKLIEILEQRPDIVITKMCWSTGLIVAVKR